MKKYTVKNGTTFLSVDSFGAQINSFAVGKTEYIWQRDPKVWNGSAPVLFPVVGELKGENKTTVISGKPYHMDIHGFAKDSEFSGEYLSESEMVLTLKSSPETLKMYPFNFALQIKFKAFSNGWKQTYILTNNSETQMPFFIGAHPGFKVPFFGDKFEDYTVEFQKPETAEYYRIDEDGLVDDSKSYKIFAENSGKIKLDHSLFAEGALIFENLNSSQVRLYNICGKGIEMDYTGFNYFGIWQMPNKNAQYICLEPWTGMNDCYSEDGVYEHKRGIRFIPAGKSTELSFTVTAL